MYDMGWLQVKVGPDITLPPGTMLQASPPEDDGFGDDIDGGQDAGQTLLVLWFYGVMTI